MKKEVQKDRDQKDREKRKKKMKEVVDRVGPWRREQRPKDGSLPP